MAKQKNIEADQVLKSISIECLAALHKIKDNTEIYSGLIKLFNDLLFSDKEKVVALGAKQMDSVDVVLKDKGKQSFYSGRMNFIVLFHALINNAEEEVERRERKSG